MICTGFLFTELHDARRVSSPHVSPRGPTWPHVAPRVPDSATHQCVPGVRRPPGPPLTPDRADHGQRVPAPPADPGAQGPLHRRRGPGDGAAAVLGRRRRGGGRRGGRRGRGRERGERTRGRGGVHVPAGVLGAGGARGGRRRPPLRRCERAERGPGKSRGGRSLPVPKTPAPRQTAIARDNPAVSCTRQQTD